MQIIISLAWLIFEVLGDWWALSPEPKNKFGSKLYKYVGRIMMVLIPVAVLYLLYAWITL